MPARFDAFMNSVEIAENIWFARGYWNLFRRARDWLKLWLQEFGRFRLGKHRRRGLGFL